MKTFPIICQVCSGEVNDYTQTIKFMILPTGAVSEGESLALSCGCVVDFPNWILDIANGQVKIADLVGTEFIEYYDEDLLMEDE